MYTKNQWTSDKFFNFKYVQYLPDGFDPNKKYPCVLFLHGAGERGDDLDVAVRLSFMRHVKEKDASYPFIFIAPQCPDNKYWGCFAESLIGFVDYILETLSIDEDRLYLTGLSMGGTGAWMLAMACPEKFAAVAPVCGTGICWYAGILKHTPIYIYHGDCDDIVPITESINLLRVINSQGGNAQIHICYGVGHNAWDYAYEGTELMDWMLSKSRTDEIKSLASN